MKWNRSYRLNEKFPHPNINIEIGNTYHSEFIEAFPEIKLMIKKWANTNLDTLNCENIGKYIRNEAFFLASAAITVCNSSKSAAMKLEYSEAFESRKSNCKVFLWYFHDIEGEMFIFT